MVKIALNGKIASGKTTTAKFIKDYFNDNYEIFNFAGRLKELATELFDFDPNNKDRKLLQDFGEAVRSIKKDAWIKSLHNRTKNLEFIIVDDMRTPDEFNYLKENGYILIRLNVSPEIQEKRIKELYPKNYKEHLERRNHFTETALDDFSFDYYINTDDKTKINKQILEII